MLFRSFLDPSYFDISLTLGKPTNCINASKNTNGVNSVKWEDHGSLLLDLRFASSGYRGSNTLYSFVSFAISYHFTTKRSFLYIDING